MVILFTLLAWTTQASVPELTANGMNSSPNDMDKFANNLVGELADKLAGRALQALLLPTSDLNTCTLGKPGNRGIFLEDNPLVSTSHLAYGTADQQLDDASRLADGGNLDESMVDESILPEVLSLRGGFKSRRKGAQRKRTPSGFKTFRQECWSKAHVINNAKKILQGQDP